MRLDTNVSLDNFQGLLVEAWERVVRFLDSLVKRRVVAAKGVDELVQPLRGALPRSGLPASEGFTHPSDHGRVNLHESSRGLS